MYPEKTGVVQFHNFQSASEKSSKYILSCEPSSGGWDAATATSQRKKISHFVGRLPRWFAPVTEVTANATFAILPPGWRNPGKPPGWRNEPFKKKLGKSRTKQTLSCDSPGDPRLRRHTKQHFTNWELQKNSADTAFTGGPKKNLSYKSFQHRLPFWLPSMVIMKLCWGVSWCDFIWKPRVLPTPARHYHSGNPSKLPTCAFYDPKKIGNLMIPASLLVWKRNRKPW